MALSLNSIRNAMITSVFGRRLGLDKDEYLAGVYDVRRIVTDLTTASTATAIPANGVVNFTGTSLGTSAAGGTFLLSNPVPGVSVTICNVNAQTSAASPGCTAFTMIRPSTAFVIYSTDGSTETTINMIPGTAVTITGLTTGIYHVTTKQGSSGDLLINGTT